MPDKIKHINQAKHNHKFWNNFEIDSTPFTDWVVVGIFYESVHWVEAFLGSRGEHSTSHSQRISAMRRHSEMSPIVRDLEHLKTESDNARYWCYSYSSRQIKKQLIPIVKKIEEHVQKNI